MTVSVRKANFHVFEKKFGTKIQYGIEQYNCSLDNKYGNCISVENRK
jgi:hypothetical protein